RPSGSMCQLDPHLRSTPRVGLSAGSTSPIDPQGPCASWIRISDRPSGSMCQLDPHLRSTLRVGLSGGSISPIRDVIERTVEARRVRRVTHRTGSTGYHGVIAAPGGKFAATVPAGHDGER